MQLTIGETISIQKRLSFDIYDLFFQVSLTNIGKSFEEKEMTVVKICKGGCGA